MGGIPEPGASQGKAALSREVGEVVWGGGRSWAQESGERVGGEVGGNGTGGLKPQGLKVGGPLGLQ